MSYVKCSECAGKGWVPVFEDGPDGGDVPMPCSRCDGVGSVVAEAKPKPSESVLEESD